MGCSCHRSQSTLVCPQNSPCTERERVSSGKAKVSCPDKPGRDKRDKTKTKQKATQWLDPKIKPRSEVPQTEYQRLCMCGKYMPPPLLKRERIYKLKSCSKHFFDAFPASIIHFLFLSIPQILFRDPCGFREIDSISECP